MISDKVTSVDEVTSVSKTDVRKRSGRTDWAKLRATTDAQIEQHVHEDDRDREAEFGPARDPGAFGITRVVIPGPDVRALREKTGLSQDEFADRYGLSLRTLQQWEQRRRVPDGPARLLLRIIELAPQVVAEVVETADVRG